MNTVLVKVRFSPRRWTNVARAGRGYRARSASSRYSITLACQRAAAKYFRLDRSNVQTPADIVIEPCGEAKDFTFTARLPEVAR
ncbi:MAG: hypothetical protein HZA93_24055 [Verrucomicrobia bacterium]|nr:hypothetical protein [Verrucomicrobiota bacterium]